MSTKKPQVLLTICDDLLKEVEDFRYQNRIPTGSEGIRGLIREALKRYQKKAKK